MRDLFPFLATQALMSAIVLLLAAIACRAVVRSSAAHRHLIWSLAFASLIVVPIAATLIGPFMPAQPASEAVPTVTISERGTPIVAPVATVAQRTTHPWKGTLGIIWLAGAAVLLLRTAHGVIVCHLRRRRAMPCDSAYTIAAALSAQLAIPARTQVLESTEVSIAETFGFVRPVVLVPPIARDWAPDRLRLVVLHEFVHIQRHDWAIHVVARIASSLFWFNPLCWYALRRLCNEREIACDDGVVRSGIIQSEYARQLVQIAKAARTEAPALAVAMVRPSNLEGRIRAILSPNQNRRSLTLTHRISTLIPALLVIAAASLVTSPAQTGSASINGTVRDASGAVVPLAQVILSGGKGQELGRTNDVGAFDFSGFPEGKYTLKVLHPGFKPFEETINITAVPPVQLDVTLDLGRIFEHVSVTAQGQARPQVPRPSTVLQPAASEPLTPAISTPPTEPKLASGPRRIRVGGNVQPAKMTKSSKPVYPQHLISQGVEGTVVMQAVVGASGQILNVQVSNSQVDPDLVKAAVEAVKQWRYEPPLLNGQPVELMTTITVDFRLRS